MKILLDESLPVRLKTQFHRFETHTIRDMGWQGKKRQELLALMTANHFDIFITFDRTLHFQRNFATFPIPVLLLSAPGNDYQSLFPLVPEAIKKIETDRLPPGVTVIQSD